MGLDDVDQFSGHSFRRTAATIMADRGASGQAIRHKLNHKSEKSCNEYITSSKSVQKSNAKLLSGHKEIMEEKKSPMKKEEKTLVTTPDEKTPKATPDEKVVKDKTSVETVKEAMSIFANASVRFENCTFHFNK